MLVDYHVHTEFSDDSVYPLEDVIKDAIRLHLDEIRITDHVDYGIKVDWDSGEEIRYRSGEPLSNVDYPRYELEVQRVKDLYSGQINVKMGMEFGIQTHTIPQFEALFRRYGLTDSMPSAELLRLYRDLGGSIVTIGSDSHAPAHLGAYIQEAKEQLKALGFQHFCTYKRMQPMFHPLVRT